MTSAAGNRSLFYLKGKSAKNTSVILPKDLSEVSKNHVKSRIVADGPKTQEKVEKGD